MGASSGNASSSKVVIKAAKKTLKKQGSGSMKIKHLTKSLLEKFESDDDVPSCDKTVTKWIEESDAFEVDGKVVTLKKSSKKRKSLDDTSNNSGEDDADKKAAKKAAKKSKKDKKKKQSSSSSPADSGTIEEWRKEHKIVLRDPRTGVEGAAASKALQGSDAYHPYQTFDAPDCIEKLDASLIRQCTKVNGFEKPSPIQAQCWVSLKTFPSKR